MSYIDDEEFGNEFQQYREWRKAMLIFTNDYESNGNPLKIGDHHGKHKEWTSDAVLNLFDTGYRWGLESIKSEIKELIKKASDDDSLCEKISDLLEKKIAITFYGGKVHSTSTDLSLLNERKELFNKLRRN
jgi:hypothetical protein